ncbi:hypothetical protein BASA50_002546 [Batrachochytrium salamandrivorans]|uniref:Uncharacterized protein n=1 Tax=Batrachochytrium salamandrivorans TaxID=1357716 RepID=A0ABQ8FP55_9FUNG|nr:hypothetical protein BASA50_002546 [Batrachochytrium salamandrivorans]
MARLLDPVTQRRAALCGFLLCQAVKIASVLHSAQAADPSLLAAYSASVLTDLPTFNRQPPSQLHQYKQLFLGPWLQPTVLDLDASHLLLWCALDLAFLVALRWARIPWLTLSMCGSLTVLVALWGFNTGIIAIIASTFGHAAWEMAAAATTISAVGNIHAAALTTMNTAAMASNTDTAKPAGSPLLFGPGRQAYSSDRPRINVDAILNSSYIIGSHTVNVRPPVIAKINPNSTVFCVMDGDRKPLIRIPLLIKGSPPFKLDYEVLLADTDSVKLFKGVDITIKDAVSAILRPDGSLQELIHDPNAAKMSQRRVGLYALHASAIGIYRLLSVREASGEPGKVVPNKYTQIVHCPVASWSWSESNKKSTDDDPVKSFDKCVDEEFTATVSVYGIAPLTVMLIKKVGNAESVLTIDAAEFVQTSMPQLVSNKVSMTNLDTDTAALVQRGKRISTTIPITFKVDRDVPHVFRIGRVIDGLNNTVTYTTQSLLKLPDSFQTSADIHLKTSGDLFVVNGHAHPQVRFVEDNIVKIRPGGQSALSVLLTGSAPFNLSLDRSSSDGEISHVNVAVAENGNTDLQITDPGSYSLVSVSDRFCMGSVQLPSICFAQYVLPPTMLLSSEQIEEKCLGAVGANINLTFTGEPPFWVDYVKERSLINPHQGGAESQPLERQNVPISNILNPRHSMTLSPKETGIYRYVFKRVGDANYPEGIHLDDLSITQIIHPHSSASFESKNTRYVRCINDTVDLSVNVRGTGPWTLVYFVVHNSQRTRYSVPVSLEKPNISITIDSLHTAGLYLIDLTEITDVNGCKETIGLSGVSIDVLAQRPTVNFQTTKPVHVIEGSRASLPISVSGKGPFEITYRGADSAIQTTRNGRDLEIFGAGVFELLSIRDAFCQGHAVEPRQLEVIQVPKPTLTIQSDTKLERTTCLFSHDGVHLNLVGKPPFQVEYQHTYMEQHGSTPVVNTKKIDTSADTFPLVFDTSKPGRHVYHIVSISDANYRSKVALQGIEIRCRVDRPPTVQFVDPGDHVYQCTTQKHRDQIRLGVKLSGIPPFHIEFDRLHDSLPRRHKNVSLNTSMLTASPDTQSWISEINAGTLDMAGRYTFTLGSVVDGTGCAAATPIDRDAQIPRLATTTPSKSPGKSAGSTTPITADMLTTSIHLADQAKITSANNPPVICVGDVLAYNFQGSPPFTVGYTIDGVVQPDVVVADPMMTLWVGAPGVITITKVCNGMACCDHDVGSDPAMRTLVKGLPKAIVDGGEDTIDDIREGDASEVHVEFIGEPPFSFTYTHAKGSAAVRGTAQGEFITNSVSNVMDHHWRLSTSLEGVFRVTAVHDRFCGYPRIIQTMLGANVIIKGI